MNFLSIPPEILSNLTNLREIQIEECDLNNDVPNDLIHGSNNLEILALPNNKLTSLPKDFFQNHYKLVVVKLDGNWDFPALADDYFYDKSNLTKLRRSRDDFDDL